MCTMTTKRLYHHFSYLLIAAVLMLSASTASAAMITYQFSKLTNNNVEDLSGQLSITMWDASMANTQFSLTGTADELASR